MEEARRQERVLRTEFPIYSDAERIGAALYESIREDSKYTIGFDGVLRG